MERSGTRDIVVIGASLGGVAALTELARALPPDFPAAVLVVQHTSPESPALLGEILDRAGALRTETAADGMQPERGRIHVAPPDRHLLLTPRGIRVVYGPRENLSRPAIDALFRTAAVHYRSRVTGVVLTGLLGDGAAGLSAVRRCGGVAVTQADAAYPEMPRRARFAVPDALQATLAELPALLSRLVAEPAPAAPEVPELLRIEARLTERGMDTSWDELPGRPTDFTCPECSGSIRAVADGDEHRFRCRVGHAYSEEALLAAKDQALEDALWLALQTLQERAQMLESMARDEEVRGRTRGSSAYEVRAQETRRHADRLRQLMATLAAG